MLPITLTVGASHADRIIPNAGELLCDFRDDTGYHYLNYQPLTPPDEIVPEDLAVTLLINSQVGWRATRSLMEYGKAIDLTSLPKKPLEQTSPNERKQIVALIAQITQLPGFGASVATKVLHKKRPDLIPILDNQAIFGAYMNPDWPTKSALVESVKDSARILNALDWITFDINRPENVEAWNALHEIEPARSRIELFDSVWWMYFREKEPIPRKNASPVPKKQENPATNIRGSLPKGKQGYMEEFEDVLIDILKTYSGRWPWNIIDLVFLAIEQDPGYLKRYHEFANGEYATTNSMIGRYVKDYTGMKTVKEMGKPKSKLIKNYTQLE